MSLTSISINVSISQFPTDILVEELFHRIGDHMLDPEPQHDPFLESLSDKEKTDIIQALERVMDMPRVI